MFLRFYRNVLHTCTSILVVIWLLGAKKNKSGNIFAEQDKTKLCANMFVLAFVKSGLLLKK